MLEVETEIGLHFQQQTYVVLPLFDGVALMVYEPAGVDVVALAVVELVAVVEPAVVRAVVLAAEEVVADHLVVSAFSSLTSFRNE